MCLWISLRQKLLTPLLINLPDEISLIHHREGEHCLKCVPFIGPMLLRADLDFWLMIDVIVKVVPKIYFR